MTVGDLEMQSHRCGVERIGRRHRRPGLVLDPDRAKIHRVVPRVICGVSFAHELRDAAVLADDVMRREDARGIFEAAHSAFEHHDRPVIDDQLDSRAFAARRVVALWDGAAPLDAHGGRNVLGVRADTGCGYACG